MCLKRSLRLATIILFSVCLMTSYAFNRVVDPIRHASQATTEEVINVAQRAVVDDDWAKAESGFREAVRLEPKQGLWRIQLVLALGQQKKWKEAFKEIDTVVKGGAIDWLLAINKKLPDGKVAFVNTETFEDEKQGILRYLKALKENKNVDSVATDVGVKLDVFAKKNRVALIYDISKFKGMRFESGKTLDITQEFIAYYNSQ